MQNKHNPRWSATKIELTLDDGKQDSDIPGPSPLQLQLQPLPTFKCVHESAPLEGQAILTSSY